jgi:hypothetical protein
MKKLPRDVQSFKKLRENNYLYVDKTKCILDLVSDAGAFFLSRPRRFGKSLLVSILEELFKGNKDLFRGLFIHDQWNWDETYEVIRIDFSEIGHENSENLKSNLNVFIEEIANDYNISLNSTDIPDKFRDLIKEICKTTGKKVVVLVDEYDIAILDNISNKEILKDIKVVLSSFYKILKSRDENLHFVLLTGVSKFAGTPIFSGLNSPTDITLHKKYSNICGYTQKELEENFNDYIKVLAVFENKSFDEIIDKIKYWYDGYSWDGNNFLYNPYSTILLFYFEEFTSHWFDSGTPSFLIKTIKDKNDLNTVFNDNLVDSDFNSSYDENLKIPTLPLMFQSGYLTIKEKIMDDDGNFFILTIPNKEVKESITKYLLNAYSQYPIDKLGSLRLKMRKNLLNKDGNAFALNIREGIANVPYQIKDKKNENYYHSLFSLMIYLLGFDIDGEIQTHDGRIDAVIKIYSNNIQNINQEMNQDIYIVEIKVSENDEQIDSALEDALKQIHEKRYYDKYLSRNSITLVPIAYCNNDVKCEFIDFNKV